MGEDVDVLPTLDNFMIVGKFSSLPIWNALVGDQFVDMGLAGP